MAKTLQVKLIHPEINELGSIRCAQIQLYAKEAGELTIQIDNDGLIRIFTRYEMAVHPSTGNSIVVMDRQPDLSAHAWDSEGE